MIHVDGSQKSGSGTIVRLAAGLAALMGEELSLTDIRAKREKPGLQPQHLKAVQALADICGGELEGDRVGSMSLKFKPGGEVRGGDYLWDIGTAGSTTLLAMTLLPAAIFATGAINLRITGGLFQDHAPSAFYMQHVLFPRLKDMNIAASLKMVRPGYVPRGGGIVEITVEPVKGKIKPLNLPEQGKVVKVQGVALSSHLKERKVSDRIANQARQILFANGYKPEIEAVYDSLASQRGAALALYASTSTGCIIGADRAGEPRRTSEEIGSYAARSLLEDLATGATVDRYLADQLILYAALADGVSRYRIPRLTDHVETNLWLVESMLGVKSEVKDSLLSIYGKGYLPKWHLK